MNFQTAADRLITKQAALDNHFEALLHKEIKPFNWKKTLAQVERAERTAERELQLKQERQKIEEERKRRQKILQFEMDRKRNAEFYSKSLLKIDETTGQATLHNAHLKHPMRAERLISIFCKAFDISEEDLMAHKRQYATVKKRHVLTWILHQHELSINGRKALSSIGRRMNGRDHSTIFSSINKVNDTPELLKLAQEMQTTVLFLEQEAFGHE